MIHPQPTMSSVPQPVSYYMPTYSFPSYLPYQTILLPSYQESQAIQQTLLDKTSQARLPLQKEVLTPVNEKFPDGRPFPRAFQQERYDFLTNMR